MAAAPAPAENIRLEGPLSLLASKGGKGKSDNLYTFKLFNNGILSFYRKDESTPTGSINLYDARIDRKDSSDASANIITLITPSQTHILKAQSQMEYRNWLSELGSIINQFSEMNKRETKMYYGIPSFMATQNEEFSDEPELDSDSELDEEDLSSSSISGLEGGILPGKIPEITQDQMKAVLLEKIKQLNKTVDDESKIEEGDLYETFNTPEYLLLKEKEKHDVTKENNVLKALSDFSLPSDSHFMGQFKAYSSKAKQGGGSEELILGILYVFSTFIVFKPESTNGDNGEEYKNEDENSYRIMFSAIQAVSIPSLPDITNCFTYAYTKPCKSASFSIVTEESVVEINLRDEAHMFYNLFIDLLHISRNGLMSLEDKDKIESARKLPSMEASGRQLQARAMSINMYGTQNQDKESEVISPSYAVTLLFPSTYILVSNTPRIGSKYNPQHENNKYIPLLITVVPDYIIFRSNKFDIYPQFTRLVDCIACLSDHQTKESFTGTIHFVNSNKLQFKTTSTHSTQIIVDRINLLRQEIKFDEFNYTLKALSNANSDEYIDATKYLFKIFDISHETLLNMFQCNISIGKQKYSKVTLYITHKHLCITNGNNGPEPAHGGDKKGDSIKKMLKFEHIRNIVPHSGLLGISSVDVIFVSGGNNTTISINKVFGSTFENCIKILVDLWAISKGEEPPSLANGGSDPTTAALQDSDKEGYLEMFSAENNQWSKYWVVLYTNVIYIFSTPHDTSPEKTIVLNKSISIMNDNITTNMKSSGKAYNNTFSILFTNEMCHIFRDNNYLNCRDWCDMINAISNNVRAATKATDLDSAGADTEGQTEGIGSITQALLETSMVSSMKDLLTACKRRVKLNILDDDVIVCCKAMSLSSKALSGKGKLAVTRRMVIFYYPTTYNIKYLSLLTAIEEVSALHKVLKITFKNALFGGEDGNSGNKTITFAPSDNAKSFCKIINDMKALNLGLQPPSMPDKDIIRQKLKLLMDGNPEYNGSGGISEKNKDKNLRESETESLERLGLVYKCSAPSLISPKYCGFLQYLDLINNCWKTVWCMIHGGSNFATPHRMYIFEDKSSAEPLLSFTLCDCLAANTDTLLRGKYLDSDNNPISSSDGNNGSGNNDGGNGNGNKNTRESVSKTTNDKVQSTFGVFLKSGETHIFYATTSKLAMTWQAHVNVLTPHMRRKTYRELLNSIQIANIGNLTLSTKLRHLFTIDVLAGEKPVYKTECICDGKQSTLVMSVSSLYIFHGHGIAGVSKKSSRINWIDNVAIQEDGRSIRIRRFLDDMEHLRNAADLRFEMGKITHKAKEASRDKITKVFLKQIVSQSSMVSRHLSFLTLDGIEDNVDLHAILNVLNSISKPSKESTEDIVISGIKTHDFIKAIKDVMYVNTTVNGSIDTMIASKGYSSLPIFSQIPPNITFTKVPSLGERNGLNPTYFGLILQHPKSWRCYLKGDERRNEWIHGTLVLHHGAVFFFKSRWDVEPYKGMQLKDAVIATAEHLTGNENSFGIFNKSAKYMLLRYNQVSWLGKDIIDQSQTMKEDNEKEKNNNNQEGDENEKNTETKEGKKNQNAITSKQSNGIKESDVYLAIQREIDSLPEKISSTDAQAILQLIMNTNSKDRSGGGLGFHSALSDQRRFYERFRKMVPRGEKIIMTPIHCCLTRNIQIPGEVFVTSNYLCFCSDCADPEIKEVIPLKHVDSLQTALSPQAIEAAGSEADTKRLPKFLRELVYPYSKLAEEASSLFTVFPSLFVRLKADQAQIKADEDRLRQRLKDPILAKLDENTKKFQTEQIQSLFIIHGARPYKNCTTGASYFSMQKMEGYADRVQADDEESSDVISDEDSDQSKEDMDGNNKYNNDQSLQLTPYTIILSNLEHIVTFTRKIDELVDVSCGRMAKSLLTRKNVPVGDTALASPEFVCNAQFLVGSASQGWRKGIIVVKDSVMLLFKAGVGDKELSHIQFSSLSLVQKYDLSCNLVSDAAIVTGINNTYAIVTSKLNKSHLIRLAEITKEDERNGVFNLGNNQTSETESKNNNKSNETIEQSGEIEIVPPIFIRLGDDTKEEDNIILNSKFIDRILAKNINKDTKKKDKNDGNESSNGDDDDSENIKEKQNGGKKQDMFASRSLTLPIEKISKILTTVFSYAGRLASQAAISKLRQGAKIGQALDATEQWNQFYLPEEEFPIVNAVCAMENNYTKTVPIPGRLFVSRNYICFSGRLLNIEARIVCRISRVSSINADENALGECTQIALEGGFICEPLEADAALLENDTKNSTKWFSLGQNYDECEFNILQKVVDSAKKIKESQMTEKEKKEKEKESEDENEPEGEKEDIDPGTATNEAPATEIKQNENIYYQSGSFTVSRLSSATSSQVLTVLKDAYEAGKGEIPPSLLNVTELPSANAFFPRRNMDPTTANDVLYSTSPTKEGWISRLTFTTQNINGVTRGVHQWSRLYCVIWNGRVLLFGGLHNSPVRNAIPLEPRYEVSGLSGGKVHSLMGGTNLNDNTKCAIELGYLDDKNQFLQSNEKHDVLSTIKKELGETASNDNNLIDAELQKKGLKRAIILTYFKAQDLTSDIKISNDTGSADTVDVVLSAPSGEIEEWFDAMKKERDMIREKFKVTEKRSDGPQKSIIIKVGGIKDLTVSFDLTSVEEKTPSYAKTKGMLLLTLSKVLVGPDVGSILLQIRKRKSILQTIFVKSIIDVDLKPASPSSISLTYMDGSIAHKITFLCENSHDCEIWAKGIMELMWY